GRSRSACPRFDRPREPLVPDREPVPLQRQVLPALGAAVPALLRVGCVAGNRARRVGRRGAAAASALRAASSGCARVKRWKVRCAYATDFPARTITSVRSLVAAMAAGALATGCGSAGAVAWPQAVDLTVPSQALKDRLGLRVYVPPGYRSTTSRYPVIYFLHGLPASSVAYRSTDFLPHALASLLAAPLLSAPP